MKKEEVQKAIELLEKAARRPSSVVTQRDLGICNLLWSNIGLYFDIPERYYISWKHWSGEEAYPVPGGCRRFYNNKDKWAGPYGKLRRDLCRHIAREMRKELRGK